MELGQDSAKSQIIQRDGKNFALKIKEGVQFGLIIYLRPIPAFNTPCSLILEISG